MKVDYFLNKLGNDSKYTSYEDKINDTKKAYNELVVYSRRGSKAGQSNGLAVIAGAFISSYPASETSFNNWKNLFK